MHAEICESLICKVFSVSLLLKASEGRLVGPSLRCFACLLKRVAHGQRVGGGELVVMRGLMLVRSADWERRREGAGGW